MTATILLVAHNKGGATKTTTAINLGVTALHKGQRVLMVDCDSGRSLHTWAAKRSEKRPDLAPLKCEIMEGEFVAEELKQAVKGGQYDLIVVDAGGEGVAAPEIPRVMSVADIVLTPCRTPEADTARLVNIHKLVATAHKYRPELRALLFPAVTSTNVNSSDVIEFYANVRPYLDHYQLLTATTRDRVAYEKWMKTGEAVAEAKAPDAKAVEEIEQLYKEVFNG